MTAKIESETTEPTESLLELRIRTGDDTVTVAFSGFSKGSTVVKAMYNLSAPDSIQQVIEQFVAQGDASVVELMHQLVAGVNAEVNGLPQA